MQIKRVGLFIVGIVLLVVSATILIIRLTMDKRNEPTVTQPIHTSQLEKKVTNRLLPTDSKLSNSLPPARNEGWGTNYGLAECGKLLAHFFENPSNYYGIYDLQEDLGQPGKPDWTSMPWDELRRRYIHRYPKMGEEFLINEEVLPLPLSTEDQFTYDIARYRLILQPKR